jgi:hypothetical protein
MGSSCEDNDKPVSGTVMTKEEENRMIAKRMSMVGSDLFTLIATAYCKRVAAQKGRDFEEGCPRGKGAL